MGSHRYLLCCLLFIVTVYCSRGVAQIQNVNAQELEAHSRTAKNILKALENGESILPMYEEFSKKSAMVFDVYFKEKLAISTHAEETIFLNYCRRRYDLAELPKDVIKRKANVLTKYAFRIPAYLSEKANSTASIRAILSPANFAYQRMHTWRDEISKEELALIRAEIHSADEILGEHSDSAFMNRYYIANMASGYKRYYDDKLPIMDRALTYYVITDIETDEFLKLACMCQSSTIDAKIKKKDITVVALHTTDETDRVRLARIGKNTGVRIFSEDRYHIKGSDIGIIKAMGGIVLSMDSSGKTDKVYLFSKFLEDVKK